MKLAAGCAPIPDLMAAGVTVGLGTDGCASNNTLDLFQEMDTAAKLHKVQRLDPTLMDAQTVVKMATIGGARAIGLGHRVGSLEPGKLADVIVLHTAVPHLTPVYHPASLLVYTATGHDVRHVIVAGRTVVRDTRLLTLDVPQLLNDVRRAGMQIGPNP
jgi:5-methylthioadenosine/S-adenosylhomocysteine deaminase